MAAKQGKQPLKAAQNQDEKLKALDVAVSHIEKSFGKGSIMKLGDTSWGQVLFRKSYAIISFL